MRPVCLAAGRDDRLHQAGDDVVDMSRHGDAWGDRGRGAKALDVACDARDRVEHGALVKRRLVATNPLGVAVAKVARPLEQCTPQNDLSREVPEVPVPR